MHRAAHSFGAEMLTFFQGVRDQFHPHRRRRVAQHARELDEPRHTAGVVVRAGHVGGDRIVMRADHDAFPRICAEDRDDIAIGLAVHLVRLLRGPPASAFERATDILGSAIQILRMCLIARDECLGQHAHVRFQPRRIDLHLATSRRSRQQRLHDQRPGKHQQAEQN